ncbi:DUF805 domain-containing protein [Mucilaginibacter sp. KACC 22063]|uniref:DUF805 domain-containing protein n=1 Tax=Mucilaginibacter sp. KACC 22063 TaxID=3025666 RepID=UPI00236515E9|nr:DUF805 domain-containing protein [Mucilaginibacter sp. KACC 22063]WDF56055.1 DUF805 domain-containing protein [Mucilaginibacter sp. KACC 22063]
MNWYLDVMRKYAQFSGRARRKEYWMFILFQVIIFIVLGIISRLIGTLIIYWLYYLASIIPTLAVGVRRMHDTGRSGWFIIVPIVNLVFALTPGTVGPNEYGPDPKNDSVFGANDYQRPIDPQVPQL